MLWFIIISRKIIQNYYPNKDTFPRAPVYSAAEMEYSISTATCMCLDLSLEINLLIYVMVLPAVK